MIKKIWPFSFFFLFFAAIASYTPYMVVYYQSLDFSGAQIGLLTGVIPLITLVSVPFWTRLADRTNRHKLILGTSLLVSIGSLALFPFLGTFLVVIGVTVFLNLFSGPILAFVNSATMYMLGDEKDFYGRIRLGGTIGFGIAASIVGVLVENNGLKMAFWAAATLIFLGFLVSLNFSYGDGNIARSKNSGMTDLIKDPKWILFLIIAVTGGIAFSASNTYFFPFMKEIGANESTMGLTLTIGTIAEIPVLLWANRLIGRYRSYGILIMSMTFTGLRLIFFAIAANPSAVMVIQVLNGLTFPLLSVAGVSYAEEHAPEGLRSTAQGLYSTAMMGVGTAIGGFIGGLLLEAIGAQGLFLTIGIAIILILGIINLVRRRLLVETSVELSN